ncbi:MAG: Hsp70 family protein [Mycobacteriales bacterium]
MSRPVGIDLGAAFAVTATVDPTGEPRTLVGRAGKRLTRTTALVGDGMCYVGAGTQPASAPELRFVRFVTCAYGDPAWRIAAGDGTSLRAAEVAALILRRLTFDIERNLGGPASRVVLTVPACFDDTFRRATMQAARIAGLTVHKVLNAPTAAAVAYGMALPTEETALVYSLGAGCFDATVVRLAEGQVEVLATRGDVMLGGLDWDNVLMRMLNRRFRARGGPDLLRDPASATALRTAAETAKHRLTAEARTRVRLSGAGMTGDVLVTRVEFEEATSGLLARTAELTERTVADAGLLWTTVDRVVMAGGSTRMPMVETMLEQLTGRPVEALVDPAEVAALGAAFYAASVQDDRGGKEGGGRQILLREVASHGLGALARDPSTGRLRNVVVLPANTPLTASRRVLFRTIDDGQRCIDIQATQGDDADPGAVRLLDRVCFPLAGHPADSPIEIVYAYDQDQAPQLQVNDGTTGTQLGRVQLGNREGPTENELAASIERVRAMRVY